MTSLTVHAASRSATANKASKSLGALPEWNLADLYPAMDAPAVKPDLDRGENECIEFEKAYKGRLAEIAASADAGPALAEAVRRYEAIEDVLGRLISYAGLLYSGNTTDPAIAKFYGDMQERITAASLHLLFFTLELNRLDDAALDKAMADPALGHYRPWVEDVRKDKPYQLEDRVEQLFHEKSVTGYSAFNRLFDETMVALRFKVGGKELTARADAQPDAGRRPEEAQGRGRGAGQDLQGKSAAVHADHQHARQGQGNLRPLARLQRRRRVAPSRQPRRARGGRRAGVVGARGLSAAVAPLLRAEGELVRQEAVAALGPQRAAAAGGDAHHRLAEAQETVLTAYGAFSPKMASIAERFFKDRWIDAPARPGKSPGAFAHPTVPSAHPYVLLNYQGKPRDVMTLAHELGHGVHQVLAAPNGPLMAPTPLTLAETASVFGEMLTFKKLLAETTDKKQRKAMLAAKVEDMINTVVRQIAFYTFERKVHTERRNGELTAERLGDIWLEVQNESLGPAIDLRPGYEVFWTYIPHFIHSPFYVYAYAFGDCLVNSLYAVYERASEGFAERYLEMLAAGGTKHHAELLKPFGLDARDPKFWQGGLGVIERMIGELEALG